MRRITWIKCFSNNNKFVFSLFGVFFVFVCFAQQNTSDIKIIDSLSTVITQSHHDTVKCNAMIKLADLYVHRDPAYAEILFKRVDSTITPIINVITPKHKSYFGYIRCRSECYHKLGDLAFANEDVTKAMKYYDAGLNDMRINRDIAAMGYVYASIGEILESKGQIREAIHNYELSIRYAEQSHDKESTANALNKLAVLFGRQGEDSKALEYAKRSIKLYEESGNKFEVASSYNNLGTLFASFEKYDKAMEYFLKALKINEEIGQTAGIAAININMGFVYKKMGKMKEAIDCYLNSLKLNEKIGNMIGIASVCVNIGSVYYKRKDFKQSFYYFNKAMEYSTKANAAHNIMHASDWMYKNYKATGNYQKALECFELNIKMRDSISSESNRKATIKTQLKYEYEKQAAADSVAHAKESEIKNVEIAKQTAEIKAKKNQQYALFGGLGLVMIFAGFMYSRFKVTQKQKGIIEHQKEIVEEQKQLVEEKQKEILDSIYYARRIQMAQIPSEKQVNNTINRLKR